MIDPCKWSVDKVFWVTAIIFKFLRSFKCQQTHFKDAQHRINVFKVIRNNLSFVTKLLPFLPSACVSLPELLAVVPAE